MYLLIGELNVLIAHTAQLAAKIRQLQCCGERK
jgi:hypothetical protein